MSSPKIGKDKFFVTIEMTRRKKLYYSGKRNGGDKAATTATTTTTTTNITNTTAAVIKTKKGKLNNMYKEKESKNKKTNWKDIIETQQNTTQTLINRTRLKKKEIKKKETSKNMGPSIMSGPGGVQGRSREGHVITLAAPGNAGSN